MKSSFPCGRLMVLNRFKSKLDLWAAQLRSVHRARRWNLAPTQRRYYSIRSISWNVMNHGLPSVPLWLWEIWHVASFLSSPCAALQEIFASELLWNQRCLIWNVCMLCKSVRMLKLCKGTIFGGTVREHRCFQPAAATRSFFGIWNTAKQGRLESLGWF